MAAECWGDKQSRSGICVCEDSARSWLLTAFPKFLWGLSEEPGCLVKLKGSRTSCKWEPVPAVSVRVLTSLFASLNRVSCGPGDPLLYSPSLGGGLLAAGETASWSGLALVDLLAGVPVLGWGWLTPPTHSEMSVTRAVTRPLWILGWEEEEDLSMEWLNLKLGWRPQSPGIPRTNSFLCEVSSVVSDSVQCLRWLQMPKWVNILGALGTVATVGLTWMVVLFSVWGRWCTEASFFLQLWPCLWVGWDLGRTLAALLMGRRGDAEMMAA